MDLAWILTGFPLLRFRPASSVGTPALPGQRAVARRVVARWSCRAVHMPITADPGVSTGFPSLIPSSDPSPRRLLALFSDAPVVLQVKACQPCAAALSSLLSLCSLHSRSCPSYLFSTLHSPSLFLFLSSPSPLGPSRPSATGPSTTKRRRHGQEQEPAQAPAAERRRGRRSKTQSRRCRCVSADSRRAPDPR